MSPAVIGLLLVLLPYQATSVKFELFPPKIVSENARVEFSCRHDDGSLNSMLWYQQTPAGLMNFIGYGYVGSDATLEKDFEKKFEMTRHNTTAGGLILKSAAPSDSAVYFCAASNTVTWFDGAASPKTPLVSDSEIFSSCCFSFTHSAAT